MGSLVLQILSRESVIGTFVLDSIKDLNFSWSGGICLASNLITFTRLVCTLRIDLKGTL